MLTGLKKLASLPVFYQWVRKVNPWIAVSTTLLLALGVTKGLIFAPADYQQGDSFRIIYVHVPSAWMSLFSYVFMASAAVSILVWRAKIAEIALRATAPLGASFTFLALATGSIWGKPMWGTWWVWDARLTSELILLFLYIGIIALLSAIEERRVAARAASVLTLIGLVNIPIIHYSVEWWSTLHQGPTVTKFDKPSIHIEMLIPLILTSLGFMTYFFMVLFVKIQTGILDYDRKTTWVQQLHCKKMGTTEND
mgnify:CR=1 FL=1